ncbi:unnamed protein product [Hymenolepis diminuta]|uniref:DUF5727 domain-containing protein n=1 Tax=Hymenolepis diminuta TaxID=6216 RepID=A0A564Z2U4_HYMDI|nr:unnamed protein product [Hymenolepis diminuta]
MKYTLYLLILALIFIKLVSCFTFVLDVLKNPETGEEYVDYEGEIFYLTDGPWDEETAFIKNECVVRMQLSKSIPGPQRKGSALCKADYEKFGATNWKEFSEEQVKLPKSEFIIV